MRRAAAALVAAVLVALTWAPHHHVRLGGEGECAACIARGAEEASSEIPDLAPTLVRRIVVELRPIEAPPTGAPLGAVPGQSPPARG